MKLGRSQSWTPSTLTVELHSHFFPFIFGLFSRVQPIVGSGLTISSSRYENFAQSDASLTSIIVGRLDLNNSFRCPEEKEKAEEK